MEVCLFSGVHGKAARGVLLCMLESQVWHTHKFGSVIIHGTLLCESQLTASKEVSKAHWGFRM